MSRAKDEDELDTLEGMVSSVVSSESMIKYHNRSSSRAACVQGQLASRRVTLRDQVIFYVLRKQEVASSVRQRVRSKESLPYVQIQKERKK